MRIGASLFLIAIGAILKFAVTTTARGVNLPTVGIILMVVGAVGLLISLALLATRRRTDVVFHDGGTTLVTPRTDGDPVNPRY